MCFLDGYISAWYSQALKHIHWIIPETVKKRRPSRSGNEGMKKIASMGVHKLLEKHTWSQAMDGHLGV